MTRDLQRVIREVYSEQIAEQLGVVDTPLARFMRQRYPSDSDEGRKIAWETFKKELYQAAGASPFMSHIFKLHSESYGFCNGCDAWGEEMPIWPCSTIKLLAKELKIVCPGR